MGLSNKTLIALISLTMALMVFSFAITLNNRGLDSLTGKAVATGTVNITIGPTLEINFTNNALDFGYGYVSPGNDSCVFGTNITTQNGCSVLQSKTIGLLLENTGNVYMRVNLTNTNYSSSFFAGTDSSKAGYAIRITTPKANSTTCQGIGPQGSIVVAANQTWYNITQTLNASNMLCATLNFSDLADFVQLDFMFSIPNTTNMGAQADVWTATATAA